MKLFDDPATDRRFNRMQWRMLFATMIGYTLFYFMRKNFSFAMPGLERDCGITKDILGNLLFCGGIVYGISKFVNGIIGDKVNPRKMLCFGLLVCTVVNAAFGFAPQIAAFLGIGDWGVGNGSGVLGLAWTLGILFVVNQFFQGTGFPPCAKLIAFWVPPKELATKMSVWNTSHSIGGGLVAKICGMIMGIGVIAVACNITLTPSSKVQDGQNGDGASPNAIHELASVDMSFSINGEPYQAYRLELKPDDEKPLAGPVTVVLDGQEVGCLNVLNNDDSKGKRKKKAVRYSGLAIAGESLGAGSHCLTLKGNDVNIKELNLFPCGMWKWCFWSMAILGVLGLVAMWFTLPGTPKEEGLPDLPGTEGGVGKGEGQGEGARNSQLATRDSALRMVFLNPVIWMLGLCNFTINASRALVADWGPTLLQEAKGFTSSEAGTVIMFFEFAGIAGMLFAGWATDRLFGGRAPRLCIFLMVLTAAFLAAFWFLPTGGASGFLGAAALCLAGFCVYGPQALTGVTATNISTKRFAGTSIGFISLFSYLGVSVAGKVCGNLAQSSGGWALPLMVTAATAAVGAILFLCLWRTRANSYDEAA